MYHLLSMRASFATRAAMTEFSPFSGFKDRQNLAENAPNLALPL